MMKNKRCIYLVLLFFFPELVLRIEIKSDILPGTYFWAQLSLSLSLSLSVLVEILRWLGDGYIY